MIMDPASFSRTPDKSLRQLTVDEGQALLRLARDSIRHELGGPAAQVLRGGVFDLPGATFVTLRWPDGDLQGCIGSLEPRRRLSDDVAQNAVAAAVRDLRGRPLDQEDADRLQVEISLLSELAPLHYTDEASALAALRPHEDGIVLALGGRRATFLPQMWDTFPDQAEFIGELKRKAGLPRDLWHPELRLYRYTVTKLVDPPAG